MAGGGEGGGEDRWVFLSRVVDAEGCVGRWGYWACGVVAPGVPVSEVSAV